jgi:hypothetical protein
LALQSGEQGYEGTTLKLGVITGGGGRGRGELKSLGSAGLMGNMGWRDDVKKELGLE